MKAGDRIYYTGDFANGSSMGTITACNPASKYAPESKEGIMLVTKVQKGIRIFYLCEKHLEIAKTYNPDLLVYETGYSSNCDECKKKEKEE